MNNPIDKDIRMNDENTERRDFLKIMIREFLVIYTKWLNSEAIIGVHKVSMVNVTAFMDSGRANLDQFLEVISDPDRYIEEAK
jgi:hypothetical protein